MPLFRFMILVQKRITIGTIYFFCFNLFIIQNNHCKQQLTNILILC